MNVKKNCSYTLNSFDIQYKITVIQKNHRDPEGSTKSVYYVSNL